LKALYFETIDRTFPSASPALNAHFPRLCPISQRKTAINFHLPNALFPPRVSFFLLLAIHALHPFLPVGRPGLFYIFNRSWSIMTPSPSRKWRGSVASGCFIFFWMHFQLLEVAFLTEFLTSCRAPVEASLFASSSQSSSLAGQAPFSDLQPARLFFFSLY